MNLIQEEGQLFVANQILSCPVARLELGQTCNMRRGEIFIGVILTFMREVVNGLMHRQGIEGGLGSPISIKKGQNINIRCDQSWLGLAYHPRGGGQTDRPRLSSFGVYCRMSNLVPDLEGRERDSRRNRRELLIRRDHNLV